MSSKRIGLAVVQSLVKGHPSSASAYYTDQHDSVMPA